jgi:hypothetical protein
VADAALRARLDGLARAHRMLFVAGLPGTGKSLVVHQLAHLAAAAGRRVHLLQWDVARPVFEASPAGRRYPLVDGITHAMVRKAVGLWARRALVDWHRRHAGPEPLLLGETPFVGGRLMELARPAADAAEPLLAAPACRFVIPVPSAEVRRIVEAERDRRAARPLHPREREDAPPALMREHWRELREVAARLGLAGEGGAGAPWEPDVYLRVYEALLTARHAEALPLDRVLPMAALSVYDLAVAHTDLVPDEAEADAAIREAERRHPDPAALARDVERWWRVERP